MKGLVSFFVWAGFMVTLSAFAEETPIQYAFSGATAEENRVTLQGAGFGAYPQASATFGSIPTDNAFDGATDGHGAIVTAQPGEGVMIFGERIITNQAAMIRCSIRTEQARAAVTIATIGDKPDRFVATNSPGDETYFAGQYQRLSVFCTPPSTGFQPVVQIVNTSQTEALTAYLDNFEVYTLNPTKYYSASFLDNDTVDPPASQIGIPSESNVTAFETKTLQLSLPSGAKPLELVLIPSGTFTMGSPDNEKERYTNEGPQHQVSITKPFYIGKYEVTQAQWKAIIEAAYAMDSTSYRMTTLYGKREPSKNSGKPNCPVEQISWSDIDMYFLYALNMLGQGTYRLPTEAEWEYACRAGTTARFYWGDDPNNTEINNKAWNYANSPEVTRDVGQKTANAWGLFDMSGNVDEWVYDWYSSYPSTPQTDPKIVLSNMFLDHVARGGSVLGVARVCRSAYRVFHAPSYSASYIGLRLVREYP